MSAVEAWLVIVFVGVPLVALVVKFAWWCVRVVLVMMIWMLMVAGAAWRGEIR